MEIQGGVTRFNWLLTNESDLWGQVNDEAAGKGSRNEFFAQSGAAGVVARQLIVLKPGSYSLRYASGTMEGMEPTEAVLQLVCWSGGQQLGRKAVSGLGTFGFSVPEKQCPGVELTIYAAGNLRGSDNGSWLGNFELMKSS